MKRTNKKLLAVLLAAILILTQLAIPAAAEYDTANATSFVFSDGAITVTEGAYSGYKTDGTALTISESGTYIVSGSCADGSIKVKKGTTGVVLILNGLTLTSADTAPICCNKSSEVTIVAAAGSVNTLTDSERNNDETYPDNENAENAVIKAKDGARLTLCGTGTIRVIANGKNGVKGGATTEEEGAASLTVRDLTLEITANVNDGLKSDRELNVLSGNITVSAADDAIASDYVLNIGAEGTAGPTIRISKSTEGIEAATVNIYSGDITVHADDDGINAANSDLTDYDYACNIYGGKIYVDVSNGDAIDSNGTLTITGGIVELYSSAVGSDGSPLDSDGALTITGGTVLAVGNASMAQTPSGTAQTYAVFGANETGGMDGMTPPNMGENGNTNGMTPPNMSNNGNTNGMTPPNMSNNGNTNGMTPPNMGNNGNANGMTPPNMGNNSNTNGMTPPDMNNGNTNGMTPPNMGNNGNTNGMTPPSMGNGNVGSAVSIAAGDTISVLDADGNVLYSAKALRSANYVFFTSDALTSGATYTLAVNGSEAATATAGTTGGMNGMPNMGNSSAAAPSAGTSAPSQDNEATQAATPFEDVKGSDYFSGPVAWAVRTGITTGADAQLFLPNAGCTRAQTVTFLWRANGSPTAKDSRSFADVSADSYYAKAVAWASENGVSNGANANSFRPDDVCTRAQFVTLLWRAAGSPESTGTAKFRDVSADSYYAKAVAWAAESGITTGTGTDSFSPDAPVTRAQAVTFLSRYVNNAQSAANSGNNSGSDRPGMPPDGNGGAPGGSSANVSYSGAVEISSKDTQSGKTYASTASDQNALLITTAEDVTIANPTVTKTGDSDGGDNCNFYGLNAGVLVKGGSTTTITGGTVTTDADGANGVFSYGGNGGKNGAAGDGTTVVIRDTTITTTGDGSGGIMTTGGGVTEARDLTVTTSGRSSAAIRTDRGGGTVTVDGGSYTTNGLGSPAIYSTADVTVSNAKLVSNLSEGVCIEGLNSITLNNCDLTANNTKRNGNATFLDSIMLYQSMSGDAASGTSHFTMTGGSLTSKSGHVFHVTNTNAVITLNGVTITNEDAENILLSVCDDGWSGGSNTAALNASAQKFSGAIKVGVNSTLTLKLENSSAFTGSVDGKITNASGKTVSTEVGTVSVTLDSSSTWTLTGDSYVTEFNGSAANVLSNGYTLYVNGVALTGTK